MADGKKTGGRQKGTPNKLTSTAKDTIAQCAALLEKNGRTLYVWASEDPANEKAFWVQIYPKLLPLQLTGEDGGPVKVEHSKRPKLTRDEWLRLNGLDK